MGIAFRVNDNARSAGWANAGYDLAGDGLSHDFSREEAGQFSNGTRLGLRH